MLSAVINMQSTKTMSPLRLWSTYSFIFIRSYSVVCIIQDSVDGNGFVYFQQRVFTFSRDTLMTTYVYKFLLHFTQFICFVSFYIAKIFLLYKFGIALVNIVDQRYYANIISIKYLYNIIIIDYQNSLKSFKIIIIITVMQRKNIRYCLRG